MATWQQNWIELMEGYNRTYHTRYKTLEAFVRQECDALTIPVFADRLGVHRTSVDRIKQNLKITRPNLNRRTKTAKVLALAQDGKTESMTALEISAHADHIALKRVYELAKIFNFEFKRLWKPRCHQRNQ